MNRTTWADGGRLLLAAALTLWGAPAVRAGLYDSYGYKASITFTGYNKSETLTNFPALVVLSNNCFSGFAYSQFKSGSNDLAFTADAAGATNLNYELDTWNPNGLSYVWVQVSALASNTAITAWWGASGQTSPACTTNGSTWTNGYSGIYHFKKGSGAGIYDSSATNTTGSLLGGYTWTNGFMGRGLYFDGASGEAQINDVKIGNAAAFTVSFWLLETNTATLANSEVLRDNTGTGGSWFGLDSSGTLQARFNGTTANFGSYPPFNAWTLHTIVKANTVASYYINGVKAGNDATGIPATWSESLSLPWHLMHNGTNAGQYNQGYVDELRFSITGRSANWVWSEFMNMASNAVYNTYGAAGPVNRDQPQIYDTGSQNLSNTSADVVGTLATNGSATATVYVCWSTTDGTTNPAAWTTGGNVSNLGSFADGTTFTNTLTGLTPDTTYYWNCCASNTPGMAWGAAAGSPWFKTMGPPGVNNGGGASSVLPYSAALNGTLTNGVSASATVYCGTDTNNWTYTNLLGTVTEAQGGFSTNQTGLARNTTYYYSILVSNQYGTAQSPVTNFMTLPYVWITASATNTEVQTNAYNGLQVVVDGAGVVLTLSNSATYGQLPVYQFGNLIVTNGAAVVGLSQGGMSPYTTTNRGVAIQSAGDVVIGPGSSINADARGFAGQKGPGAAYAYWMGGTHGARGPSSDGTGNTNATYGSATMPATLGSGGESTGVNGGAGGGAIKLIVPGNLVVNGTLSANGQAGTSWNGGGGAGGSIWVTGGGMLGGTGEVQVSGGVGAYQATDGGGGGRISIDDTMGWSFSGNIRGASGPLTVAGAAGSAGTVYIGTSVAANFTVVSNQTIILGNNIENRFGNLTVYGTLTCGGSYVGSGSGVVIRAANLTVEPGGRLSADGWGLFITGPGFMSGAGGTYAGKGENNTNAPYGYATAPTCMGCGGGGTYFATAGGAMELIVSGSLNVLGAISANGQGTGYTSGSGGSIWIDTGSLAGNGSISANAGSAGSAGSRGGGGRIAVYYHSSSTFSGLPAPGLYTNKESISSTVTVKGGYNIGSNGPEDGSIYIAHVVPQGTVILFQ